MMFKRAQKGFSLVELMIVVAIIGILAALALPKFSKFQAKARQAEAKSNLSHIYTLETAYHGDNDSYATLSGRGVITNSTCTTANPLGFILPDCSKVRYEYSIAAGANGIATEYVGTAVAGNNAATSKVFPGCLTYDTWTINQVKTLSNTVDGNALCN